MHADTRYADTDLIKGYIARKGVKTFHTEALTFDTEPEVLELGGGWFAIGDGSKHQGRQAAEAAALNLSITGTGRSWCDIDLEELKAGGWARGLRRRGLEEHAECTKAREGFLESLEDARNEADPAAEAEGEAEAE